MNVFGSIRMAAVFCVVAALTLAVRWEPETPKCPEMNEAKKYQQAEQELRKTVQTSPENLTARYYLGMTLLELEKNAEAEEQFRTVQDLRAKREEADPRADKIELGLARAQMGNKEYGKAGESLDKAKELNPESAEVYMYRGKLGVLREDYRTAATELDEALKRNPEMAYAHYYAGISAANVKRPDKMVEHFQYFLKLAPDAPEAAKVKSYLRSVR